MALLLIIELGAGILAYTMEDNLKDLLNDGLMESIPRYRNANATDHADVVKSFDFIQANVFFKHLNII